MQKTINEEMVKYLYQSFKNVYENNQKNFDDITMKEIKENVYELLGEEIKKWNKNSLQMYIDDLIYAIKGKKFTRFLNKFAYKYFEENLCNDFPTKCKDVKNAFRLHFEYKKEIQKRK